MSKIKNYLKRNNITLKEFSERIGVSRPTLDTYIMMYESGQTIPKERYDILFKRLFEEDYSFDVFESRLNQMEILFERDKKYGTINLKPEAADYVSMIHQRMIKDLCLDGWNKYIYVFVDLLISNYRDNDIFNNLVEYFVYLNGKKNTDDITEDQIPYLANMFKTFHDLLEKPIGYKDDDYKGFLERCSELKEEKQKKINDRRNQIKSEIDNIISEYENAGIEVNEKKIIEALSSRLNMKGNYNGNS